MNGSDGVLAALPRREFTSNQRRSSVAINAAITREDGTGER
jgi:hypothetical protein